MAKVTKQSKFNRIMEAGRELTVAQVRAIGFSNVYDAAYQARQVHGMPVQRFLKTNSKGKVTSVYALDL
jgi:hypothetical protein